VESSELAVNGAPFGAPVFQGIDPERVETGSDIVIERVSGGEPLTVCLGAYCLATGTLTVRLDTGEILHPRLDEYAITRVVATPAEKDRAELDFRRKRT